MRENDEATVTEPGAPGAGPAAVRDIPLAQIQPNPRQPRRVFAEEDLAELAASIADVGVLQPVVVRPLADGGYELVMGERRCRASRQAGRDSVPAVVRSTDDTQMLRQALLENLQRVQLNPLEEAAAYQELLTDLECTHEEVAAAVGKSRSHVSHTVALLRLPPAVQRRVAAGVLSAGHAKALLRVPEPSACDRLAERIVAEGISVRSTEELIALGDLPGWEQDQLDARRRRRGMRPPPPADLAAVATELGDSFDTRVRIEAGKSKGRIVVEFSDRDDLDRILGLLRPPGRASAGF